jgi:ActR/RegA family two-component response regulator
MTPGSDPETVLVVDDEEPVRKTFREWLEGAGLGCRVVTAADAEAALVIANRQPIDLAILDWNLGAGSDGLQLLEDLTVFHPDVVAIMITGFADQATPLKAMRMGIRDYLDKNQDLDRTTFLHAVRRQLEKIRPARRERRLHRELLAFREAVEKVLPLVQAAAALSDPVPLPAAVRSLFRFVLRTTGARDGVLLARSYDAEREPAEVCRAWDTEGRRLDVALVPFARSVAGSVIGMQEPSTMEHLDRAAAAGAMDLQPFERGRRSLLAVPLSVAPGVQAVLEVFDKQGPGGEPGPFTEADRRLGAAAADIGTELLRHELAERQTQRVLFDAVGAALGASEAVAASIQPADSRPWVPANPEDPPPAAVMDRLRQGLAAADAATDAGESLRLAEAVRVLALRHGSRAVAHCTRLVEEVRRLLDDTAGTGEAPP